MDDCSQLVAVTLELLGAHPQLVSEFWWCFAQYHADFHIIIQPERREFLVDVYLMFSRFPRFLKLCWIVTHSQLQHCLQQCESSTRCLWCVLRHQLSPDFDPVSVRHAVPISNFVLRPARRTHPLPLEHSPQVEMLRPAEAPRTYRSQE